MTFTEFEEKEHQKRVAHFIRFIKAHSNRIVTVTDAEVVFGFCTKDAIPVFVDAMAQS